MRAGAARVQDCLIVAGIDRSSEPVDRLGRISKETGGLYGKRTEPLDLVAEIILRRCWTRRRGHGSGVDGRASPAWAESLLAIFRVQRVTVLEIDPAAMKNNGLKNNQVLNQTISHVLSDEVTVTQKAQRPQLIADAAMASNDAGFTVRLLPDKTPSGLLLETGTAMQMKLNRDRIQSILNEAGRSDLQIPESVDGATVAVRVPPA